MANDDLGGFARRIREIGRKVEANASVIVVQTALAVDQAVVLATPVDTGRARSNWIVSLGSAAAYVRGPYAPGKGLGQGEGANAAGALAQGQSVIRSRRPGSEAAGDIYIQNNLPYIGRLNEGSSAQAPANFVNRAVIAGVRAVKGSRVL